MVGLLITQQQGLSYVKYFNGYIGVFIIGVLWEIFEWVIEGDEETYGTKKAWAYNTMADIVVETGIAWWMVL